MKRPPKHPLRTLRRLSFGWTPRSLLWQTFFRVAVLLLFSLFFWAQIYAYFSDGPRAQDIAQNVVSIINLTRSALINAEPSKRNELLVDLVALEGIRIYPAEPGDVVEEMPSTRMVRLVETYIRMRLGTHTRFAAKWKTLDGFWVSFRLNPEDEEEYWVTIPSARLMKQPAFEWVAWGIAVLFVALIGAFLLASRLSIPLRHLTHAAQMVGSGKTPPIQPETGPVEIALVARAFNQMTGDLARAEADRELILASVSHDLRTPLARLRLGVEMSGAPAPEVSAMVADIEEMDRIIGQFLDYGREKAQNTLEEVELSELVEKTIEPYRLRGSKINFTAPGQIFVQGAELSLRRALANLIDNALRYAGANEPLDIDVFVENNEEVVIQVADRGPGIPESQIERLKRPFTRLESARSNTKGAGLGLAIVERALRNQDGRLEFDQRPGGGLIARIHLPYAYRPKKTVSR